MAERKTTNSSLTEDEILVLKERVREVNTLVKRVPFPYTKIGDDIKKFSKPLKPCPPIVGDSEIDSASKILSKLQKRRSLLSSRKVALLAIAAEMKTLWAAGIRELCGSECYTRLRNEMLREAAAAKLMDEVYFKKSKVEIFLEQISTLLWELTQNQSAIETQVSLFKERAWDRRREGVE